MKAVLRNLLAVGISCGISLLAAEALLWLGGVSYPAFYTLDRERGYSLRPSTSGFWTREGRGWVQVNSAGFRGPERSQRPDPGVLRIAVLGDSFTEAFQVNEADSWVGQLQRQLSRHSYCSVRRGFLRGVEVLNFGVGGYGTGQQWLTWRYLARQYHPSLVLLALYPGNDFTDNEPQPRTDRPVFHLDRAGHLQRDDSFRTSATYRWRSSWPGQLLDGLMNHSRLLQLLNEAKNRWANRPAPPSPSAALPAPAAPLPASEDSWAITVALVVRLAEETAPQGARLMVVSPSSPEQVWPRRLQRPADPFAQERRLAALLAAHQIPYLPLGPELQRQADARGLILHGFPGQAPGVGHWNATAHRLAAEAMAPWMCGR